MQESAITCFGEKDHRIEMRRAMEVRSLFQQPSRSNSVALEASITDETLLDYVRNGQPSGLQDEVVIVAESFHLRVSTVSRLSSFQQAVLKERDRESQESGPVSSASRPNSNKLDQWNVRCSYCQKIGHLPCHCGLKRVDLR